MRIVSMQKGDDIKAIITRFSLGTAQIQKVLKENDADFMRSDHLGWILTCPSNLGTGLRAGCMVKIPKFSAREDFKTVLAKMGLQVNHKYFRFSHLIKNLGPWNRWRRLCLDRWHLGHLQRRSTRQVRS